MQTVKPKEEKIETKPYEPPQIIHEGQISTRAGSPLGNPGGVDGIDPGDLFD